MPATIAHSNYGVTSALRLEAVEMQLSRASVGMWERQDGDSTAAVMEVAGGLALYGGAGSPLSQAIHCGMKGPVSEAEFDRLEEFFRSRGSGVTISLCPLADGTLVDLIGKRGYRISHFESTLARPLSAESQLMVPESTVDARQAGEEEAELWALTLLTGFGEGVEPTPETLLPFSQLSQNPFGTCWMAERDGEVVGAAGMGIFDGAAMLYGDATLPESRRCGAQSSLIHARLLHARQLGCDLAMACTMPGTTSQRNYERFGFRVAYTKVMVMREW